MADVVLQSSQYGKAETRMVTVLRGDDGVHTLRDLNVSITLSGDMEAVHRSGDNANIVATDSQKNTVYAFARQEPVGAIEAFALRLARHFVGFDSITRARVAIAEYGWSRLSVDGAPHPHAFSAASSESRVCEVVVGAGGEWVVSGLRDLVVLKSTGSEFTGYLQEQYTTLPETRDRILATAVAASWRWRAVADGADWDGSFTRARTLMLERFASLHSLSLQQTLFAMASDVLEADARLCEVRLSMPNKHHFVVDLSPFALDNPNQVFIAADRPYGLIEAVIATDDAPPAGPAWDPYPLL